MIEATVDATGLTTDWDAIVVGAGPAGSFTAHSLSKFSKRILLVDKAQFPRPKVCGCCVNAAAQTVLKAADLGGVFADLDAVPLQRLQIFDPKMKVAVRLPGGYSVSRNELDAYLIRAAIERGASFLPGAAVQINGVDGDRIQATVKAGTSTAAIYTKVAIVADGLNGHALDNYAGLTSTSPPAARFGCGAIVSDGPDFYQAGNIYMACDDDGYVGLVRLEDNRIDIAAALDLEFSRAWGGPAQAAARILSHCRLPVPSAIEETHWMGTEALTRRRKGVAAERLFVIGDSCGYPEPFTGQGIAWALQSALAVSPLAIEAIVQWEDELAIKWQRRYKKLTRTSHLRSQLIANGLRQHRVRQAAMQAIALFPTMSQRLITAVSGASCRTETTYCPEHAHV